MCTYTLTYCILTIAIVYVIKYIYKYDQICIYIYTYPLSLDIHFSRSRWTNTKPQDWPEKRLHLYFRPVLVDLAVEAQQIARPREVLHG